MAIPNEQHAWHMETIGSFDRCTTMDHSCTDLAAEIGNFHSVGIFPRKMFLFRLRKGSWTPIRHEHQLSLHLY